MGLRDAAFAAVAEQDEARRLADKARKAQQHAYDSQMTRQFFAHIGVSADDVTVDGKKFVIEDMPGNVRQENGAWRAKFHWWCNAKTPGGGGTYDSAEFTDLAGLGRCIQKIDHAKNRGRYHLWD